MDTVARHTAWVPRAAAAICGWFALALLAALPLSAETQINPRANPILAPGRPWAFDGFAVTVPASEGWVSLYKDMQYADLAKDFPDGTKAAVIVEARKLSDSVGGEQRLLNVVREQQAAPPDPDRTKLLEYSAEPFAPKGVLCARFSAKFEDRRGRTAAPELLIVRGVSCAAPGQPDLLVTLRHAQRSNRSDIAAEVAADVDPFLESLKFVQSDDALLRQARLAVRGDKPEQAAELLRPAAEGGDGEAAMFLGNMYLYGRGVEPDTSQARRWLELAAQQGRIDALYNLGAIYDKGIGVQRDVAQAMRWFLLAADQRDGQAQLNIALFYLNGDGVPKDIGQAETWLRRAAINGNRRAQGILEAGKYRNQ